MKHDPKDVAMKVLAGFYKDKVPVDVGLAALSLALIMSAKAKFTDEEIVSIFKTNIEQLNKDMAKQ
jgi:transcription initiation factor IIE alpha subunit